MIFVSILYIYYKDVKEFGKERLAISLSDRMVAYFMYMVLPCLLGIVAGYCSSLRG